MSRLPAAGGGIREVEGSGMTSDREQQRRREGVIFLILFALTIPAANWFIGLSLIHI